MFPSVGVPQPASIDQPSRRKAVSLGSVPPAWPLAGSAWSSERYLSNRLHVLPVKCYRGPTAIPTRLSEPGGTGALILNQHEWQLCAESVISCVEIEDVRLALLARIADRYAARDGILRTTSSNFIDYKEAPLNELGVRFEDAQIFAAFRYLQELKELAPREQFSWTRRYLEQRLEVFYRGPRSQTAFLDRLIRRTVLSRRFAGQVAFVASLTHYPQE
jgi:hypothetical protein